MNTYGRLPVSFVKGNGAYLQDDQGKQYLDALSGIAVCGLGHAHPKIAKALSEQGQTLLHTSNLYDIPHQTLLAKRLCTLSGMDNAFFCNLLCNVITPHSASRPVTFCLAVMQITYHWH